MSQKITYRNLRNYKYQVVEDYTIDIPAQCKIELPITEDIIWPSAVKTFIKLTKTGQLTIFKGYAWDGPSGPTIDTKDFMRGSLVHDALYQLIREEKLDYSNRDASDRIIQRLCLNDGMNIIRAAYVYRFLKWFGGAAAKPGKKDEQVVIMTAP